MDSSPTGFVPCLKITCNTKYTAQNIVITRIQYLLFIIEFICCVILFISKAVIPNVPHCFFSYYKIYFAEIISTHNPINVFKVYMHKTINIDSFSRLDCTYKFLVGM